MRSSKKREKSTQSFVAFYFKAFLTDVLTPTAAIKMYLSNHSFMKVLRHIFMVFVQGDSKRAPDSPQKSDFCQKWALLSRRFVS